MATRRGRAQRPKPTNKCVRCGYRMKIRLVMKDHAEETAMDRQPVAVIVDKAKLPEFVHEMTDARPRRSYHLREIFLTDLGKYGFASTLLGKVSEQ